MTPYDTFHRDQREDHSILASLSKTNTPLPEAPRTRPLASHRRHLHPGPGPTPAHHSRCGPGRAPPCATNRRWAASWDKADAGPRPQKAETKGPRGGEGREGNHFGGRDDKGNQKTRGKNTLDETERMERPPSLRKTRVCKANRLNAFWEL